MNKKVELPLWVYVLLMTVCVLNIGNFVIDKLKNETEPIVKVFYNGVEVTETK